MKSSTFVFIIAIFSLIVSLFALTIAIIKDEMVTSYIDGYTDALHDAVAMLNGNDENDVICDRFKNFERINQSFKEKYCIENEKTS